MPEETETAESAMQVFDAYDKQSAERKERRIKATQKRIKQNMQMRAQERAKNSGALPAQQGTMQKKKVVIRHTCTMLQLTSDLYITCIAADLST